MKQDLRIAISKAIERERDAYSLYTSLTKETNVYNLQILYRELAIQELKHEAMLKELLRTNNPKKAKQETAIKYPEFEVGDKLHSTSSEEGIIEGLKFAIKREIESQIYYTELFKSTEDIEIQEFFHFLIEEEKEHERKLFEEYKKFIG
ncbi:MAG: ferritin family protein [Candidatus Woesearchaeota archaeon]